MHDSADYRAPTAVPSDVSGWGQSRPFRGKQRFDRPQGREDRRIQAGGPRPQRPARPKAWGHQALLKAHVGKRLTIFLMDGSQIVGDLVELDAYTLLVNTGRFTQNGAHPVTALIFKHDISSIQGLSQ